MTDLAKKIADALYADGVLVDNVTRGFVERSIRSALPVAHGEAVGKLAVVDVADYPGSYNEYHFTPANRESNPVFLPGDYTLYAAPPASRIAELEREVERLREALTYYAENKHWYEGMSSQPVLREHGDKARKALAAQEKGHE